jgi:serine/threonine protein kinase
MPEASRPATDPDADAATMPPPGADGPAPTADAETVAPAPPPREIAFAESATLPPSRPLTDEAAPVAQVVPAYEILGELGRGGMGVAYRARHVQLDRPVALKTVLSGGHAGAAEPTRFHTEAEAVARLQHPNIVQIHEVGETGGLPFPNARGGDTRGIVQVSADPTREDTVSRRRSGHGVRHA